MVSIYHNIEYFFGLIDLIDRLIMDSKNDQLFHTYINLDRIVCIMVICSKLQKTERILFKYFFVY